MTPSPAGEGFKTCADTYAVRVSFPNKYRLHFSILVSISMYKFLLWAFLLAYSHPSNADSIKISNFSNNSLADWQVKSFSGATQYQVVHLNNRKVLKAYSLASASSLYKEVHIDLHQTPYLNWSWQVDKKLNIKNERTKQGDDFSARIYLIVKGEWFFWQTKSLNYVWSSHNAKLTAWPNPYAAKNVMMLAIRDSTDKEKHWYTEKRHALNDLKQYFGKDIRYIDAIAIMTDTDNSKEAALSYYDNLYFSEQ